MSDEEVLDRSYKLLSLQDDTWIVDLRMTFSALHNLTVRLKRENEALTKLTEQSK